MMTASLDPSAASATLSRRMALRAIVAAGLGTAGCHNRRKLTETVTLPARHSVVSDQFVILSDFRLSEDHALVSELKQMRHDVSTALDLDASSEQVVVYLFENEQQYWAYISATWPILPYRRAYFFDHGYEREVYTFWSNNIHEDLRHEFTHGLLHIGMPNIPLWLDEGLAEYFETRGESPGAIQPASVEQLARSMTSGWRPDLDRLEKLTDVTSMTQADYAEAWAWVHFMLHQSPDTRSILLGYLRDLRNTNSTPGRISTRLFASGAGSIDRFMVYVGSLNTFSGTSQALAGP